MLRAARSLAAARADELGRTLDDPVQQIGPPHLTETAVDRPLVADLDELAARARAERVATDLTLRADALTALG